jgi:hypothetical protein
VSASSNNPVDEKAAVSISEMARMVGLSRQRFGQLVKAGVFPEPLYDLTTKRPFYDQMMQHSCLEVRRRNCGINGKVVMFYARRSPASPVAKATKSKKAAQPERYGDILDGLKALGLVTAKSAHVVEAVAELFPGGIEDVDAGEVIRAVFMHLRGTNTGEKVGRKP